MNYKNIFSLLFCCLCTFTMASQNVRFEPEVIELPKFAELVDLAIKYGSVNWLVGSRPYTENIALGFGKTVAINGHQHPVYHAYGFGGAGLTLSPGVAWQVESELANKVTNKQQPVLILGAGVTGLSIARELIHNGYQKVTLVSAFFPPGAEQLLKNIRPVTKQNYYPSCVAGGYIMPVKIGLTRQLGRTRQIIETAQDRWNKMSKDPTFAALVTPGSRISLLPDSPDTIADHDYDAMAINKLLGYELYPIEVNNVQLFGTSRAGKTFSRTATSIVKINHIIQVDPGKVQLSYIQELINSKRVEPKSCNPSSGRPNTGIDQIFQTPVMLLSSKYWPFQWIFID